MSQFTFLQGEWALLLRAASKAEATVHADPRTTPFYSGHADARRARRESSLHLWNSSP